VYKKIVLEKCEKNYERVKKGASGLKSLASKKINTGQMGLLSELFQLFYALNQKFFILQNSGRTL
jgi:hypothetical protein